MSLPHTPGEQKGTHLWNLQAATKQAHTSSNASKDYQPLHTRACIHPQQPTPSSSHTPAHTLRHKQHQSHTAQVLNLFNMNESTVCLADHHTSSLLHIWHRREQDTRIFNIRLIGDLDQSDQHVGIGLADLLSHSLWAKISYDHKDDMQTCDWASGGPVHVVLPVCTSPAAVREVVQALFSGMIHLGDDAEEILLLASAMQVWVMYTPPSQIYHHQLCFDVSPYTALTCTGVCCTRLHDTATGCAPPKRLLAKQ